MTNKFDEEKVAMVRDAIVKENGLFITDSYKMDNKAGARRARKSSLKLEKLLKEYRKISIK